MSAIRDETIRMLHAAEAIKGNLLTNEEFCSVEEEICKKFPGVKKVELFYNRDVNYIYFSDPICISKELPARIEQKVKSIDPNVNVRYGGSDDYLMIGITGKTYSIEMGPDWIDIGYGWLSEPSSGIGRRILDEVVLPFYMLPPELKKSGKILEAVQK